MTSKRNDFKHREDGITEIYVTRKNGDKHTILVDTSDFEKVKNYIWHVFKNVGSLTYYTRTRVGRTPKSMHQLLLDVPEGMEVDHADCDGLNNSRKNLRIATSSQNKANTHRKPSKTGFRGVFENGNKFQVRIGFKSCTIPIGTFNTALEAAEAYDKKAVELYGIFAITNASLGTLWN